MRFTEATPRLSRRLTLAARSKTFSGFGASAAGGFTASESPRMMLTRQYSMRAMKTNLHHMEPFLLERWGSEREKTKQKKQCRRSLRGRGGASSCALTWCTSTWRRRRLSSRIREVEPLEIWRAVSRASAATWLPGWRAPEQLRAWSRTRPTFHFAAVSRSSGSITASAASAASAAVAAAAAAANQSRVAKPAVSSHPPTPPAR